jgi:hypothetical protein
MLESDKCVLIIIFSYCPGYEWRISKTANVTTRKRILEGPYAFLRRQSLYSDNKWLKNHKDMG